MVRERRVGVSENGVCELDSPLLVRGDIVSVELTDGRTVEFPESWGLVHDVTGKCINKCEIFVCPYVAKNPIRHRLDSDIHQAATSYWGDDYSLRMGDVVIPDGPWQHVGHIVRIYYDRYGELASPYQHPFDSNEKSVLYKQKRGTRCVDGKIHKTYRISLPDGCVINAHGFVWP